MAETIPLKSSDVAAAVAAGVVVVDPLFKKRIRFHKETKPYLPLSGSNSKNFELETLNPSTVINEKSPAIAKMTAQEKGKKSASGLESVLGFSITFKRIGAGLENLGNTCYLNSVLQCLTYTEPFAAYCHSGQHKNSCRVAGFCTMCALQNHVTNALQASGKIVSPHHIVRNLRCISRNFRNWRQEDAHEYMVNLLESMHKSCLPSGVPTESPSAYEKSLVHKIFGGRLRSQVKCTQCGYCSNKFDPFLDLSLEICNTDSLIKALKHFTAIDQLDGGAREYQCQRCKEKVKAYKQLTIHNAPYVLTIHLKRFGPTNQKIDKRVSFEPTLILKPFVSDQQEGDLKYTLYGVLVHNGYNTHSGHYYCYVRTSTGVWHRLDDNKVRPVSEKDVLSEKAYMLFYVRDRSSVNKRPADVLGDNIMTSFPTRQPITNGTLHNAKETTSFVAENKPSITVESKIEDVVPKEKAVVENTLPVLTQSSNLSNDLSHAPENDKIISSTQCVEDVHEKKERVGKKQKLKKIWKPRQYFGGKQLLLASISKHKRKHKKCKKDKSNKEIGDFVHGREIDNQCMAKCSTVVEEDFTSLLRGLKQTQVPHWDDVELPQGQVKDIDSAWRNKRHPRYDDWDEALDQGKRKKIKKNKDLCSGADNPFQKAANELLKMKMKPRLITI